MRFPLITGHESAAEQTGIVQQLREWRRYWLQRLYGGWAILAAPAVIFGGLPGWISVVLAFGLVVAAHCLVHARLLAVVGSNGEAWLYRMFASILALSFLAASVGSILILLDGYP